MLNVDRIFISELKKKLVKIDNKNLPQNDKDGKIGEKFVKEGIKYYLWEKNFKVRKKGNRVFSIKGHNKSGPGGIDFHLKIRYSGKLHDCYVEVKNWKVYQFIPQKMFNTEMLDRFTKNANKPGVIWILIMNKANIGLINSRCWFNNIEIITLDRKITSNELNIKDLTDIMNDFLRDFSYFFTHLSGKKPHNFKHKSSHVTDRIKEDIRLGKPYSLILPVSGYPLNR